MKELIERLERLTGPDREVDGDIAAHLTLNPSWAGQRDAHWGFNWSNGRDTWSAPTYTASIDAAMTLVPEGCDWLRKDFNTMTVVRFAKDLKMWGTHFDATGVTPAIALCIAVLKAKETPMTDKPLTVTQAEASHILGDFVKAVETGVMFLEDLPTELVDKLRTTFGTDRAPSQPTAEDVLKTIMYCSTLEKAHEIAADALAAAMPSQPTAGDEMRIGPWISARLKNAAEQALAAPDDYEQYRSALQAWYQAKDCVLVDRELNAIDKRDIRAGLAFAATMPSQHSDLADRLENQWKNNPIANKELGCVATLLSQSERDAILKALRQSPDTVRRGAS